MWGGRFAAGPASVMREINASIPFDKRLWKQDIVGSKAHVAMLAKQGIVDGEDAQAITEGLTRIAAEYERSEEHTSELQSLMRISYAVFCLKKKRNNNDTTLQQIQKQNKHRTHIEQSIRYT